MASLKAGLLARGAGSRPIQPARPVSFPPMGQWTGRQRRLIAPPTVAGTAPELPRTAHRIPFSSAPLRAEPEAIGKNVSQDTSDRNRLIVVCVGAVVFLQFVVCPGEMVDHSPGVVQQPVGAADFVKTQQCRIWGDIAHGCVF